jgi:hypothetical protein
MRSAVLLLVLVTSAHADPHDQLLQRARLMVTLEEESLGWERRFVEREVAMMHEEVGRLKDSIDAYRALRAGNPLDEGSEAAEQHVRLMAEAVEITRDLVRNKIRANRKQAATMAGVVLALLVLGAWRLRRGRQTAAV